MIAVRLQHPRPHVAVFRLKMPLDGVEVVLHAEMANLAEHPGASVERIALRRRLNFDEIQRRLVRFVEPLGTLRLLGARGPEVRLRPFPGELGCSQV